MAKTRIKIVLALAGLIGLQSMARAQDSAGPDTSFTTPIPVVYGPASESDLSNLRAALTAAKAGNVTAARASQSAIQDNVARKLAFWAMVDANPTSLRFVEADAARRDLAGWPHEDQRQATAEKLIESADLSPAAVVSWFDGARPATAQGAMALASAERALGRNDDAAALIKDFWRNDVFEADVQKTMLARFGDVLTVEDHIRRADILLYGTQGPAAKDVVALLPPAEQAAAQARIALRSNASTATRLVGALDAEHLNSPGVAFERAGYFQRRGQEPSAIALLAYLPKPPPTSDAAARIWLLRKQLVVYALQKGDVQSAYAAADAGLTQGADAAESEFYAGWLALDRMNDPARAAVHFARIAQIGNSPITRSRALYWQGRAAEASGDQIGAKLYYIGGSQYPTSFYGQLAAEKAGLPALDIGTDPPVTEADRARFNSREAVRAIRLLQQLGAHDTYLTFVLSLDDMLPTAEEEALLVDMVRGYGDTDPAMRVVRTAATRGMILPERGYPFLQVPPVQGGAESAFVHSISRQESNFDPAARSSVGARGMMQFMPSTAQTVARRLGMPYSVDRLTDAQYNMTLGSAYLGQMIDTFGGSYVMAAAAYNAGPTRLAPWTNICGDPRSMGVDPLDFIECIPFSETRNYVMRTLETMMVYRARLNGGTTPLTLSGELRRGSPSAALPVTAEMAMPADGGPPPS
ncbi:MAG: Lytic transglycosylase catalytic [Caulobacteraceae bacterium]|nr:Lytic transglycosylase catalytic [Caulobacteraceae bacterium]